MCASMMCVYVSVCNCNSDFVFSLCQKEFCLGKSKILPPFTAVKLENGEIKQFGATELWSSDRTRTC